ncbi:hypothetical protein SFUMM280S_05992 [Streptomyces fumanus]
MRPRRLVPPRRARADDRGRLAARHAGELFGPDATAELSYEVLTDVPPAAWLTALETARANWAAPTSTG